MGAFLYLAQYGKDVFRVGASKSNTPNTRRIKPYYGEPPRRIVGAALPFKPRQSDAEGGVYTCAAARLNGFLAAFTGARKRMWCGMYRPLPGWRMATR